MADECHLCLLGLIFLSSLLTGINGVNDDHVFISSGENVRLPCNNALPDCNSTTWNYNNRFRHSATVELIGLGIKKKNTGSHERLSLGSDCSLNIKNIIKEDYGSYTCQQWTGVNRDQQQGDDARVYLHVLHVSSSSSQTEISAGSSVSLSCQLYSSYGVYCHDSDRSERINLLWVNQAGDKLKISDSRYQISAPGHCIITTTLLNEDDNREWRCEVTQGGQVKTSATYTVKISDKDKTMTAVTPVHTRKSKDPSTTKSSEHKAQADSTTAVIPVHITNSQDHRNTQPAVTLISVSVAAFAVFLLVVFCLIWRKRAGNKKDTDGSLVKDENEDKGTYETINMSITAAARDNEQTDDVTYSEVSSSGKKPVKSLTDHNDSVTYAAIRGTQNEQPNELYASVNKNKCFGCGLEGHVRRACPERGHVMDSEPGPSRELNHENSSSEAEDSAVGDDDSNAVGGMTEDRNVETDVVSTDVVVEAEGGEKETSTVSSDGVGGRLESGENETANMIAESIVEAEGMVTDFAGDENFFKVPKTKRKRARKSTEIAKMSRLTKTESERHFVTEGSTLDESDSEVVDIKIG
ncbi:hypothetical protein Q8A67_001478 [Cirrhinus molitorella]|uniref:Uncharacterized protein n=1 Tax=Cirrhinus molitorella TaxID=172907 RepID=A0AA88QRH6_9TELE|nr:hypothetical protein Q8A67_001478 [Cirrhinus molitorella]